MIRCGLLALGLLLVPFAWSNTPTSARAANPTPAVDLTGKWQSCKDGHSGPLHASFCKIDDTCCRVQFQGRFFAVIPFRHTVNLHVTGQRDGTVFLSGSSNLPLMGTYRYTATATATEFHAE